MIKEFACSRFFCCREWPYHLSLFGWGTGDQEHEAGLGVQDQILAWCKLNQLNCKFNLACPHHPQTFTNYLENLFVLHIFTWWNMNICISKLLYDEEKVLDEDDGVYPAGVCEGGEEQGVAVVLYITIGNTKIFMLC